MMNCTCCGKEIKVMIFLNKRDGQAYCGVNCEKAMIGSTLEQPVRKRKSRARTPAVSE